jgi:hypothetical protein
MGSWHALVLTGGCVGGLVFPYRCRRDGVLLRSVIPFAIVVVFQGGSGCFFIPPVQLPWSVSVVFRYVPFMSVSQLVFGGGSLVRM